MSNQQVQEQLKRHLSYLEQDKSNLSLLVKISDLYVELDDLDAAQEYLNQANEIDRIACLGHQGLLHLNRGLLSQAQENFMEALTYEDTPALRYNLGFIYFINSDLENAAQTLAPVIEGEHHPEAKRLMARIHHGQGELDQALDLAKDVLTHDINDAETLGLLALLHFDRDENEQAIQAANQALEFNPDNYDAKLVHSMLGLTTQETTVEDIEKLLQINPGDCRLWFALGSAHMNQGDFERAEYSLQKAIEIYPEFYDCRIALGWCALLQDKLDDAFNAYQIATHQVAELADGWGGLALVAALQENNAHAEELIQKAKALSTDCFLAEIAEVICFNLTNPIKAKEHLVQTLRKTGVPVSEKLAAVIEELQEPALLH
ncbi:tetratricopeptide repeat protein [Legionella saoudiensis]|uniref:tetratricopeptide repeat protein n=1 Tax=Legionella saoudiensis TaxID=1750561 RepID=UPI0007308F27|nr:tetratricopeptide repeat protein [Legionella saoudiensis]